MELPTVHIYDLRKEVADTKSPGTARYYLAMLNRLEEFNQSPEIDLNKINPRYVSKFGSFLLDQNLSTTTVNVFQSSLRAVMKNAYGIKGRDQFKKIFGQSKSKPVPASAPTLQYNDLMRIVEANLSSLPLLDRIRTIFLYCVVSGGIDFNTLRRQAESGDLSRQLPQQDQLLDNFEMTHGRTLQSYVLSLPSEKYDEALRQLGIDLHIKKNLSSRSAEQAWISAAKKAGITSGIIAGVLPADSDFVRQYAPTASISEEQRQQALQDAANVIVDLKTRWYVMKCVDVQPSEIEAIINRKEILRTNQAFRGFVPPTPTRHKKERRTKSIVHNLYFFNCTRQAAAEIRKAMRPDGWVFTLAGSNQPAPISDAEMRTFMLLCDVSSGTIDYHFPDDPAPALEISKPTTAKIVAGEFSGNVGVLTPIKDDNVRVQMTFTTLTGFKVTTIVPREFLQVS